ncbi:dynein gamma chain protein [Eggerthellaceae bacterium zg-1084]|uniref:Dynein gamma chain protein n=1 Tax=Berryella wangjianweii TaxID=2734634 RepID=A0A6M8J6D7_9ACTN|nr:dynein gamma chain protein [Berryella wangjianweii]NPD31051.1 dynein gamma chain protein [Berryella wangjianweii]NPD31913.1 dynein gamma chain protein [Eggerthellaceae bacterium zg-997]QKF07496.1 dynein gamma chain protein [Berryella wangjianweii]
MCANGVNTGQFDQMIQQIDDHIKLERRWTHTLAHMAADAGMETAGAKLHEVQALLDEVRAQLDGAREALEDDAERASGVSVNLV